ncbi:MAG TPA: N-acetyltransferase [Phycisphaerae bacterium]|nr:N-acetyltransferase [Phycisphaerae bacterium]
MIRQVTQADIPRIRSLMQSEEGFWKQETRGNALEIAIASAKDLALVWEEDGTILGFICAHDLGVRGYLSNLIVSQPAREKGIGRQLVQRIEEELCKRGCSVFISDVWRSAVPFYRSLGWSEPNVTLLRKKLSPEPNES